MDFLSVSDIYTCGKKQEYKSEVIKVIKKVSSMLIMKKRMRNWKDIEKKCTSN